ncbi:MAG TPA: tRNA (adenosine(37)-N6)-dimethylallyltransferase MiaA [Candidatus Acidoferrales bacterium]|nr:tRNA (adenosine(37)-N6)-dimethylallyltransferase MiaA [Candidatus Acidoferrales bacterium]
MTMSSLPRLIVILGPTASGKSSLAIALAEHLGGEILVCDSTQVYRRFNIGTAKVPASEQRGIAHHLVDLVDPYELFTAGEYRRRAIEVLESVRRRGSMPIFAAGTGLYLRALLDGLSEAPPRSDELRERLRHKCQRRGAEHLHHLLARLDTAAASRIGPRDTPKIIRALEMRLLAGKPLGEIYGAGRSVLEGYDVRKIGLLPPRSALYARIDARVTQMLQAGWIDEVRSVAAAGVPADAKPFQFIGYSELRQHLEGRVPLEAAILQIQQATRNFAKRQITWFRKEPGVRWLPLFGDTPEALASALDVAQCDS